MDMIFAGWVYNEYTNTYINNEQSCIFKIICLRTKRFKILLLRNIYKIVNE